MSHFHIGGSTWHFLVVATDGLFESMENEDVIAIVKQELRYPARRLAHEAKARGISLDNIGVAAIPLWECLWMCHRVCRFKLLTVILDLTRKENEAR